MICNDKKLNGLYKIASMILNYLVNTLGEKIENRLNELAEEGDKIE